MALNIEYVETDSLTPYEGNAKEHPPEQLQQIQLSIEEFGMNDPIAVWGPENLIIEGHGRWLACTLMGMPKVPVIRLDDLTDEQRRAYTLIHNKLTLNSDFNLDKLEIELAGITDIDMGNFGFLDWESDDSELMDTDEDDYDEPTPTQAKSKLGEIYRLGDHYLMVGDSTSMEDVQALMAAGQPDGEPPVKADMCVTDPPYNVAVQNTSGLTIKNDDMAESVFVDFLTDAFYCMEQSIKPGAPFYIWYASRNALNFLTALTNNGLQIRQQLIWVKSHFVLGHADYMWQHEPCMYGWKEGPHYFRDSRRETTTLEIPPAPDIEKLKKDDAIALLKTILGYTSTTVMRAKKPAADDMHPTMKPVTLIAYQVQNSARRGDTVLDLFGGSGSTMIACEQTQRKARLMEYDPRYADVIIDRWEKFTGRKAELIGNAHDGLQKPQEGPEEPAGGLEEAPLPFT